MKAELKKSENKRDGWLLVIEPETELEELGVREFHEHTRWNGWGSKPDYEFNADIITLKSMTPHSMAPLGRDEGTRCSCAEPEFMTYKYGGTKFAYWVVCNACWKMVGPDRIKVPKDGCYLCKKPKDETFTELGGQNVCGPCETMLQALKPEEE